jgi:hypothetical protein
MMTANVYSFPISQELSAARLVLANPADCPDHVLDAALTVIDWIGTAEDRARIDHLPAPDLIHGRTSEQLAAARQLAMSGKAKLEAHGVNSDSFELLQVECAEMLKAMQDRKTVGHGMVTIRRAIPVILAGAAAFVAFWWGVFTVMLRMGGM